MDNTNIDTFDKCAAIIFARLYAAFPLRIPLPYNDIPSELFTDDDSMAEMEGKFDIYRATVRWLSDAGYIWASDLTGSVAEGVVLTPRALEVLKVPSGISKKSQSLGQVLVDAVKSGAKDAAQKAAGSVISLGFRLLIGQLISNNEHTGIEAQ